MRVLILMGLTFFSTTLVLAQTNSIEVTCRAKAKEVAADAYSSCLTDNRTSQIDEIRKNYERDLSELKSKYDQELKRLGGEPPKASGASTKKATRPSSKKVAQSLPAKKIKSKSLAQKLPAKKTRSQEAMPIQNSWNESQMIAVDATPRQGAETGSDPYASDAAGSDQFEIVEMPAIEE